MLEMLEPWCDNIYGDFVGHKGYGVNKYIEEERTSFDLKKRIHSDLINAEFAIIEELNKHSKIFKKIKDDYLKDRFDDVRDVCKRILENLQNKKKKKK